MRKNEIKICLAFFAMVISIFILMTQLSNIKELKAELTEIHKKKEKIAQLHKKLQDTSLYISKSIENLTKKDEDINDIFKRTSKKAHIADLKIKKETLKTPYRNTCNVTIKFSAARESDIYRFIIYLQKELNIIFKSIKIVRNQQQNSFLAKIECSCVQFNPIDDSIIIHPGKIKYVPIKKLHLFGKEKEEKKNCVHAIISHDRAYINGAWRKENENIDDYEIKKILDNSIIVRRDGEDFEIKLGHNW